MVRPNHGRSHPALQVVAFGVEAVDVVAIAVVTHLVDAILFPSTQQRMQQGQGPDDMHLVFRCSTCFVILPDHNVHVGMHKPRRKPSVPGCNGCTAPMTCAGWITDGSSEM